MKKAKFRAFYTKHFDRVYRFVFFRVANNADVAEDLTSEIFMKALRSFEKYDEAKSESAWIMTIARNHLINHYRDKKEQVDLDDVKFSLQGIDGERQVELEEDVRSLYEVMNTLTPQERRIIELKHLQGYKNKEIAEVLGKTEGACRIELHRAMKRLTSLMNESYETAK